MSLQTEQTAFIAFLVIKPWQKELKIAHVRFW